MIANVLKVKITDLKSVSKKRWQSTVLPLYDYYELSPFFFKQTLAQYSVQSKDMFIYTYNHLSKPDRFLATLYFDKFGGAYNEGSGHG